MKTNAVVNCYFRHAPAECYFACYGGWPDDSDDYRRALEDMHRETVRVDVRAPGGLAANMMAMRYRIAEMLA